MKTILLLGAGKSATVLIDYLLKESEAHKWKFIIADANREQILLKTKNSCFAEAVQIDITSDKQREKIIQRAHVVISMMPPALHFLVAKDCVEYRKHLLTASYLDNNIKSLKDEIAHRKLLFICEIGLDPGIDHMSAMKIIDGIKDKGGSITSFKSHCGGLVAPESDNNPWHYKISWNPRNVVLAGKAGAEYKLDGKIIGEGYEELFDANRTIETEDASIGSLSYYPNRNSLSYIDLYNLHDAKTFLRTTLRYRDFMLGWKNIIDLKLTNEMPAYDSDGLSIAGFFQEHMNLHNLTQRLMDELKENEAYTSEVIKIITKNLDAKPNSNNLVVNETGELFTKDEAALEDPTQIDLVAGAHDGNKVLQQLYFLGMDDECTVINKGIISAAEGLQFVLENKLALAPADKDMVVMQHDIEYELNSLHHRVISSLIVLGKDGIHTAMAKTVGLPLGIAAKLILNGTIKLPGLHIPIVKEIYEPVLKELRMNGVSFIEREK